MIPTDREHLLGTPKTLPLDVSESMLRAAGFDPLDRWTAEPGYQLVLAEPTAAPPPAAEGAGGRSVQRP